MRAYRTLVAVVVAVAGCGGGASDRCAGLWKQAEDGVRRLGSEPPAGEQDRFLRTCRIIAANAPECLDDEPRRDDCDEIRAAAADEADPPRRFELGWRPVTILADRATAQVPAGWTSDGGATSMYYSPPSGVGYQHSSLTLRALCMDTACAPHTAAEWKQEVDNLSRAARRYPRVRKDEALDDTGWILIAELPTAEQARGVVNTFRWKDGGRVMFQCDAVLHRTLIAHLDEFEAACRALTPTSFDAPPAP